MKVRVILGAFPPEPDGLSQLRELIAQAEKACAMKAGEWSYDLEQHHLILEAPGPLVRELRQVSRVQDIQLYDPSEEQPTFGELMKTWEGTDLSEEPGPTGNLD